MTNKNFQETIQNMRQAIYPNQTLCRIEFDNGSDTNDFVPNEILTNQSISTVDWWNENKGMKEFISVMQGKCKAINVEAIKEPI